MHIAGIDINMDIASDMAVATNWGMLSKEFTGLLQMGFGFT